MPNPPTQETARRGIALMVLDALLWTDFSDPTLTADASSALVEACRLMAIEDVLTEVDEERVMRSILAAGWNLAPPADGNALAY